MKRGWSLKNSIVKRGWGLKKCIMKRGWGVKKSIVKRGRGLKNSIMKSGRGAKPFRDAKGAGCKKFYCKKEVGFEKNLTVLLRERREEFLLNLVDCIISKGFSDFNKVLKSFTKVWDFSTMIPEILDGLKSH